MQRQRTKWESTGTEEEEEKVYEMMVDMVALAVYGCNETNKMEVGAVALPSTALIIENNLDLIEMRLKKETRNESSKGTMGKRTRSGHSGKNPLVFGSAQKLIERRQERTSKTSEIADGPGDQFGTGPASNEPGGG